jgi:predicted transcriptional regulator
MRWVCYGLVVTTWRCGECAEKHHAAVTEPRKGESKRLTADELGIFHRTLKDCDGGGRNGGLCAWCRDYLDHVFAHIAALDAELAEQTRLHELARRLMQVRVNVLEEAKATADAERAAIRKVCQWAAEFETGNDACRAGRDINHWGDLYEIMGILGEEECTT